MLHSFFKLKLSFIIRFTLFLPLLLFINFPFEYNADYSNYYPNYSFSYSTYEPLFEILSSLCRDYLELDFFGFWFLLSIIELCLISLIFRRVIDIVISYPSLIGMSQFFYGTQIRYAISSLVLIYAFLKIKNVTLKFVLVFCGCFFHYGGLIVSLIFISGQFLKDKYIIISQFKTALVFTLAFLIGSVIILNLEYLISFTRFHYYANSGKYVEPISLVSFLYILSMFLFYLLIFAYKSKFRIFEVKLAILFLMASLLFSPIAGLSGRISLVYFIFEPLVVSSLMLRCKFNVLVFFVLLFFLFRVLFYLIINQYVFYSIY